MVARMLLARLENPERFVKGSEMLDGKKKKQKNIHIYGEIQEKVKQKLEIESRESRRMAPFNSWKFEIAQTTTYSQKNVHQLRISGIIYYGTFRSRKPRLGRTMAAIAPTAPPPALPPVTPHSSCLQEAAAGATPHIAPVKSHFSYLCFLRSVAVPTATKPRQGNEDDRQKKKKKQNKSNKQLKKKQNSVQD